MVIRQKAVAEPDRLCTALEACVKTLLADGTLDSRGLNVDAFVEQASTAVHQLLLNNSDEERWLYFRIAVESSKHANSLVAQILAPLMEELKDAYLFRGWWWINKTDACGSAVRLRVLVDDAQMEAGGVLEKRLLGLGCSVSKLRYEPELCLFGGPAGMKLAHAYFCFESEFLAMWLQHGNEGSQVLPEGLSLAIVFQMLRAVGLDLFERWDVFNRLCDKRPQSANVGTPSSIQAMVHKIVSAGPARVFELYDGEKAQMLKKYRERLGAFGLDLARTFFAGHLECGLREFLTPLVLFHWNRSGLSAGIQSALCWAVARQLQDLSRQSATQNRQEVENYGTTTA